MARRLTRSKKFCILIKIVVSKDFVNNVNDFIEESVTLG